MTIRLDQIGGMVGPIFSHGRIGTNARNKILKCTTPVQEKVGKTDKEHYKETSFI
jgi:hypothetical protein